MARPRGESPGNPEAAGAVRLNELKNRWAALKKDPSLEQELRTKIDLAFLGLPKNEKKLAKKLAEIDALLASAQTGAPAEAERAPSQETTGSERQAGILRDVKHAFEVLLKKAEENHLSLEQTSSTLFHSVQDELSSLEALVSAPADEFDAELEYCRNALQLLAEDVDSLANQRKVDLDILADISADRAQKRTIAFRVLGVGADATTEEIKKAYRRLSKQHHPDLHKNSPSSNENFRLIGAAYEFLERATKQDFIFQETEAAYRAVSQKIDQNGFDAEKDFPDLEAAVIEAHGALGDARLLTQSEFDAAAEVFKHALEELEQAVDRAIAEKKNGATKNTAEEAARRDQKYAEIQDLEASISELLRDNEIKRKSLPPAINNRILDALHGLDEAMDDSKDVFEAALTECYSAFLALQKEVERIVQERSVSEPVEPDKSDVVEKNEAQYTHDSFRPIKIKDAEAEINWAHQEFKEGRFGLAPNKDPRDYDQTIEWGAYWREIRNKLQDGAEMNDELDHEAQMHGEYARRVSIEKQAVDFFRRIFSKADAAGVWYKVFPNNDDSDFFDDLLSPLESWRWMDELLETATKREFKTNVDRANKALKNLDKRVDQLIAENAARKVDQVTPPVAPAASPDATRSQNAVSGTIDTKELKTPTVDTTIFADAEARVKTYEALHERYAQLRVNQKHLSPESLYALYEVEQSCAALAAEEKSIAMTNWTPDAKLQEKYSLIDTSFAAAIETFEQVIAEAEQEYKNHLLEEQKAVEQEKNKQKKEVREAFEKKMRQSFVQYQELARTYVQDLKNTVSKEDQAVFIGLFRSEIAARDAINQAFGSGQDLVQLQAELEKYKNELVRLEIGVRLLPLEQRWKKIMAERSLKDFDPKEMALFVKTLDRLAMFFRQGGAVPANFREEMVSMEGLVKMMENFLPIKMSTPIKKTGWAIGRWVKGLVGLR